MKFFLSPLGKLLIALAMILAGIYGLYTLSSDLPPPRQADIYGLRPCFEEEVRLDAARFWLAQQQAKSSDVERFDQLVSAYNQRCAHRTVTRRDRFGVEVIHSEVRANRDALWAEGIARFQSPRR
jgi:hypothetical protein